MYEIKIESSLIEGLSLRTMMRDDRRIISMSIEERLGDALFDVATIHLTRKDFLESVRPILQALDPKMTMDMEMV